MYEKNGVPIVFNTSFNLGGEALVETIYDAIDTCNRTEIKVKIETLLEDNPDAYQRSSAGDIFGAPQESSSLTNTSHSTSRVLQRMSNLNAASLFDFLDADDSDNLTYEELNTVLELNQF